MDRDEVGMVTKKRRLDDGDTPNLDGEGSSKVVETQPAATNFVDNVVYRLYFKGLVSKEYKSVEDWKKTSLAGFGVAICDQTDKLLFQIKEPVTEAKVKVDVVEIRALVRGLSEAFELGIRKVVIYCDENKLYQNLTAKRKPRRRKVVKELMEEVQCLRKKFTSSEAVLVASNDVKFASKLAREAIDSQFIIPDSYGYNISSPESERNDDEDYNPWACGCDCGIPDHAPTGGQYFNVDEYIEYYTL